MFAKLLGLTEECPDCESGYIIGKKGKKIKCPTCGGSGEVRKQGSWIVPVLFIILLMIIIFASALTQNGNTPTPAPTPTVSFNTTSDVQSVIHRHAKVMAAPVALDGLPPDNEIPEWFRNILYIIGGLAGLNTFGRYFLLWSGVLVQCISAVGSIVFVWFVTVVSRPKVKEAYRFGFYISCLIAGLIGLGEAYMLLTVPGGWLLFIVEIIATVFIAFIALGGAFSYIGAVHSTEMSLGSDGSKQTKSFKRGPRVHLAGRDQHLTDGEVKWTTNE